MQTGTAGPGSSNIIHLSRSLSLSPVRVVKNIIRYGRLILVEVISSLSDLLYMCVRLHTTRVHSEQSVN